MSPIRNRVWDGSVFLGQGGGDIVITPDTRLSRAQRQALVDASTAANAMTYIANANTTGLLPYWDEADLTPIGTATSITTVTGIIENSLIWGQLVGGTFGGPDVRNSIMAGVKPTGGSMWLVKAIADNQASMSFRDCIIDSMYWMRADLNPPGGAVTDLDTFRVNTRASVGIKGGRMTLRNTIIRNCQDIAQLSYNWVSSTNTGFFDMQHCWVYSALFYRGPASTQPEGTHSDFVQIQTGGNITLKWNTFGWISDGVGYAQTVGYNSGNGAIGSHIYWQQEVSNAQAQLVYNVEVAYNLFLGAVAAESYYINLYYDARFPNDMLGSSVHHNLFQSRTDGRYIIRDNTHYAYIFAGTTNRRVSVDLTALTWTDLGAVPINNG